MIGWMVCPLPSTKSAFFEHPELEEMLNDLMQKKLLTIRASKKRLEIVEYDTSLPKVTTLLPENVF